MTRIKTVQVLYNLIKPHWYLATRAFLLAASVAVLEGFSAALVMPLLQVLENKNITTTAQMPEILQPLIAIYSTFPQQWHLLIVIGSFFLLAAFKNICRYLSDFSINNLQLSVGNTLRQQCIDRFLQLEVSFYNQSNSGSLLSYVNEQAQRSQILASYILEIATDILVIFVLLLILVSLSPVLTVITIISLGLVTFLLRTIVKLVQIHGQKSANSIEQFSMFVTELIGGIRVIKSFGSEFKELDRARRSLHNRYTSELNAYRYNSAIIPLTETSGIAVLLVILTLGTGFFSASQASALPLLLTYMLALLRMLPRISHLNSMRSQLALLSGSLEAINQFLSNTSKLSLPDGYSSYIGLKKNLTFENVTFSFTPDSEPILKKLSFTLQQGTTTAIVGPSGSGKSTLVDLIMRFYDPDTGNIKIDDTDLRALQKSSWRQAIAMVSQDTFLFNTSIRENILYGRLDATDADVIEAAKKAYAYEFIQDLPEGLDTIVGNRGMRLSGGQRQRIAIARAILRDPDLLILDEATSALDTNSERIVQQAIEEASRDRTVIMIAHRLSTIEKADTIFVLANGEIVEHGTHQELLEAEGKYWSLYKSQMVSRDELMRSLT